MKSDDFAQTKIRSTSHDCIFVIHSLFDRREIEVCSVSKTKNDFEPPTHLTPTQNVVGTQNGHRASPYSVTCSTMAKMLRCYYATQYNSWVRCLPGFIIIVKPVSKMIFSSLVFETNSKNNQFNVIALGIKIYRLLGL